MTSPATSAKPPRDASTNAARDAAIVAGITDWFKANARDLPWRHGNAPTASGRDPYRSLVSELMLQQTQVSRVLEKFAPFVKRFPTPTSLADAPEEDVLAMWAGLGYYRRARLLHAAAKACRDDHAGAVPETADALATLPGVGAYTAGAIASLVHHQPVPIVDGNVSRVLLRIEGRDAPHGDPAATKWAWKRAGELAEASGRRHIAAFNEGLMELGATVCTPKSPSCPSCPVERLCVARAEDRQQEIPSPKRRVNRTALYLACGIALDAAGHILLERRPESGMWAGLWAPPCIERTDRAPQPRELRAATGAHSSKKVGAFTHETTHRAVHVGVYTLAGAVAADGRRWARPDDPASGGLATIFTRAIEIAGAGNTGNAPTR